MKDSSYNLFQILKKNFSMFVGSEKKLKDGLKVGQNAGFCYQLSTNFTGKIAKKFLMILIKKELHRSEKLTKG